jgi:hypothetical protein
MVPFLNGANLCRPSQLIGGEIDRVSSMYEEHRRLMGARMPNLWQVSAQLSPSICQESRACSERVSYELRKAIIGTLVFLPPQMDAVDAMIIGSSDAGRTCQSQGPP